MKKYSIIIANATCDDIDEFDAINDAVRAIDEQIASDGDNELIYAVRDNERGEIVYTNR